MARSKFTIGGVSGAGRVPAYRPPAQSASTPTFSMTAPAPVSAPVSTPYPVDPAYDQTVAALGSRRDSTVSGLQGQQTAGLLDYGFTAQSNPTTGVPDLATLSFDPSNPFSRAALLKRRYDQAKMGTTNSYAARGQLYSGAAREAQNNLGFQQQGANDALLKALGNFLLGNQGQQQQAATDYELGVAQAGADRIARAPSNPAYSPVVPDTTSPAASTASLNVPATNPGAASKGGSGLAPGVSIVNGRFLYNGRELTQHQWTLLNSGRDPYTGKKK